MRIHDHQAPRDRESNMNRPVRLCAILAALLSLEALTCAADWPMWRHDAARSGATPQPLPSGLRLAWTRDLPPQRPAWPESQHKLQFDAGYEPIVVDGRLIVGSTVDDCVTAYDAATGEERWRFVTEGPVRFPAAAWHDRVFVGGDDGYLYSLDLATGHLIWKVRGGPQPRPIIGNDRLISTWPIRGAPVVADDTVYIAAGIWPTMGVFVQAIDCSSGEVRWSNSRISSLFVTHPHGADAFGTISPQGPLTVSGENLLVPGGRTLPAVFDRRTGELKHFDFGGKGSGGFTVTATGRFHLTDGELCLIEDGLPVARLPAAVFDGTRYVGTIGHDLAVTLYSEQIVRNTTLDRRGRPVTTARLETVTHRLSPRVPGRVHLVAGNVVYVAGSDRIAAYPLADAADAVSQSPVEPLWSAPFDGEVTTMLAADGRLYVVTREGRIACYAADAPAEPLAHSLPVREWQTQIPDEVRDAVAMMTGAAPLSGGYAVISGADLALVRALVDESLYRLVVVDADEHRIAALRAAALGAGVYGERLSAHAAGLREFHLPPYLADLIVAADGPGEADLAALYETLRPYGGAAFVKTTEAEHARLAAVASDADRFPGAALERTHGWTLLRRVGPLPGSGVWTHQYGDASNSVVSSEERVQAPLAVLWWGGPSNDKVLPRHGHGPTPQVVGGRLFIEGADMLRCVDVYTGRLVWEREFPGLGEFYDNTSHQPGAGEIGSNYVSLEDHVYVIHAGSLLELDARTGETTRQFAVPGSSGDPHWSWLAVEGDTLLATAAPVEVEGVRPSATAVIPKGMEVLIPPHARWRYRTDAEPDESWKAVGFDDSGWREGESGFGFGVSGVRTSLDEVRGRRSTVFLRSEFQVSHVDDVRFLRLMVNFDDAFVAYLNGREVVRAGFRGGGSEPFTVRSRDPAGYETFDVPQLRGLLQEGRNVLCLEGHNASATDADFLLDGYVLAGRPVEAANAPAVADLLSPVDYAAASRVLLAFNRHSGELLWQRPAEFSYRHNGICAGGGRVYCIDGLSERKLSLLRRRGVPAESKPRLVALDLASGEPLWSTDEDVFGTFLNYSREHDVVLQGGSAFRDRAADEVDTGLAAYRGATGDVLWKNLGLRYFGPCLILPDRIITNGDGGFELSLLTGEPTGWRYSRMYGCNTAVGCLNMLTFRSGAAGFFDLASQSGTGNLGGFRSSCTSNLIPADGVLSAPDYTRTCTCAYQVQTSLAFIHAPDVEYWTFNDPRVTPPPETSIGINLGAPGDRRDEEGTMWFDFPSHGGPSPELAVDVAPSDARWFAAHSSTLPAGDLHWVGASGVGGAKTVTLTLDAIRGRGTVRLVFADPDRLAPGERVFSVKLQGRTVLDRFDVAAHARVPGATVLQDFPEIEIEGRLTIELMPATDSARAETLLSGVRVVADPAD